MIAYLVDEQGNDVGKAEFSVVPHSGERISLRLYAGSFTKDGKKPSIPGEILLRVDQVTYMAFNAGIIDYDLQAWTSGKDAYAVIEVSPLDEDAQAYMQHIREQARVEE